MKLNLSTGQIRELCDLERSRGGIGIQAQNCIDIITNGARASNTDLRLRYAIALWHPRYGGKSTSYSFWDYLEDVPPIPVPTEQEKGAFPCLVLPKQSFEELCEVARVQPEKQAYEYGDLEEGKTTPFPYWMLVRQVPEAKSVKELRETLPQHLVGLNLREALSFSILFPNWSHVCVSQSACRNAGMLDPQRVVCLARRNTRNELYWHNDTVEHSSLVVRHR